MTIDEINGIGELAIKFNQKMFISEVLENSKKGRKESKRLLADEKADDKDSTVDLLSIIRVDIVPGDEDSSASMDKLEAEIELVDYDDENIQLRLNFENPLYISTGDSPDKLIVSFIDPELFAS